MSAWRSVLSVFLVCSVVLGVPARDLGGGALVGLSLNLSALQICFVCVCVRARGCACRNMKEAGKHCFRLLTIPLLVRSSLVYSFVFVKTAGIVTIRTHSG